VEEAAKAGIEHIVFVLTHGQEAIGHYFDRLPELEQRLKIRGDLEILEQMVEISEMAEISYVYQKQQLGPGHAVLAARSAIGSEPFAVFFPDDLIISEVPTIGTMIEMFNEHRQNVIAVSRVEDETIPSKGIINPQLLKDNVYQVIDLIEKPSIQDAPSNLAIVGRYVLTADIFDALESLRPSTGGEIWLTDAISELLKTQKVLGYEFPGIQFDVGTPLGLQMASVYEALRRDDTSEQFRTWLNGIL
jgi:UTP--glucose-1-phosphate uridylyltransferase